MKCPNSWCNRTTDEDTIKNFKQCLMCDKIAHDVFLEEEADRRLMEDE